MGIFGALQDAAGPLTDRDYVWHKERAVAVPVASVPDAAALVVSDEGEQLHVSSAISSTAGCGCRGSARSWPWVRTLSARSASIIGSTLAGARTRSTRCLTCWRRSDGALAARVSFDTNFPEAPATPLWRRSTPPQRVKPVAATPYVSSHRKPEEQLREVGALGHSINDLNNMLKLPHLRGQFGEASLERLLADFLPAHMFEIQSSAGDGNGRADAVIQFPDRRLPSTPSFLVNRYWQCFRAMFSRKSTTRGTSLCG